MRLAFTSDLHCDATALNAALLPHLAARVATLAPDAFVIAGDVAETLDAVRRGLEAFAAVQCPKFYLPGNHDLFVERSGSDLVTSCDKYERALPAVATATGFGYLGLEPARVGEVAFVGVTGWYDYAFRDPRLDAVVAMSHYRAGRWRDVRAFDRGHVLWPRGATAATAPNTTTAANTATTANLAGAHPTTAPGRWADDLEVDAWMRARLADQIEAVRNAPAVVGVVHVLPFAALVQRGAFGPVAFHDAWIGSAGLGAGLRRAPQLRAVVCGHLHRDADLVTDGVRVVARPVGTLRDPGADLAALGRDRIGVLEIS